MTGLAQYGQKQLGILQKAMDKDGFSGLTTAIGGVLSDAALKIADAAPDFVDSAADLVESFLDGIDSNSGKIGGSVGKLIDTLGAAVIRLAPKLAVTGTHLLLSIGNGILDNLPLLKGTLNFIWNHGWYHDFEQYDTDGECSFTILDFEGNELFTSNELEGGVFMTYINDCKNDAVNELDATDNVQVYPNPTQGLLNVSGNGSMCITVSNMLGQQLMETTADDSTTIDLSRFESGVYLIRIETENGITVQKVNLTK